MRDDAVPHLVAGVTGGVDEPDGPDELLQPLASTAGSTTTAGTAGTTSPADEIARLAWLCVGAGLASAVVVLMAQLVEIPRAVLALHPVFALIALTLARTWVRMAHEQARVRRRGGNAKGHRALVLGAGAAAKLLIAGIQHRGWTVLGMLDDDARKHGSRVAGIEVLGGLERLNDPDVLDGVTHLILAMPSATGAQRKHHGVFNAGARRAPAGSPRACRTPRLCSPG